MTAAALARDPLAQAIAAEVGALPDVLLNFQRRWVADDSPLKVHEKSRRTGITWAEASDNVLTAARSRAAGGMNVYYIGYNMDMAIEYIEACALWARVFNAAVSEIEPGEELFEQDGDRVIKTYTIRFESGFRIVALSSRPANLRGKQGVVVIDEAAFHQDLDELLKAALALLIWGGRVHVISTHNGDQNPFNVLINDIRAGRRAGKVHRVDFREAVADGLYRRVCLRRRIDWTAEGETQWVADVYKFYGEAANEELDVIPSQGSGAWLSQSLIEARSIDAPVLRWRSPEGFALLPDVRRAIEFRLWLDEHVSPCLDRLDPACASGFGMDFGRSIDLSVIAPWQLLQNMTRRFPFLIELADCPHRQQEQCVNYVTDRLPRFRKAVIDARGNGSAVAEFAAQRYGASRVEQLMLSETWYREQMPPLKAAFEDAAIEVPRDADVTSDLRAVRMVRGVARVPDLRVVGKDGSQRHGDAAIAIALGHYASRNLAAPIEFMAVPSRNSPAPTRGDDDHPNMESRAW